MSSSFRRRAASAEHDQPTLDDIRDAHTQVVSSIRKKADKNKSRARAATLLMVASTALIPLSIVASSQWLDFILGKLVPSALAAISTLVAAWVQLERPHERWSLYRRYQRLFESDRIRFDRQVDPFDGPNRVSRFAELLARRQVDLHDEWAGLLPRSSDLAGLGSSASRLT